MNANTCKPTLSKDGQEAFATLAEDILDRIFWPQINSRIERLGTEADPARRDLLTEQVQALTTSMTSEAVRLTESLYGTIQQHIARISASVESMLNDSEPPDRPEPIR